MRSAVRATLTTITALLIIGATIPTVVTADDTTPAPTSDIPIDPPVPDPQPEPEPEPQPVAPPGSKCPELYPIVVDHWPNAALHWPVLDKILWRESRCRPWVVNRYGCVGLTQICPINHRRLGVTKAMLKDPAVNIAVAYRLCLEQVARRRSCYRPWWVGRFRP